MQTSQIIGIINIIIFILIIFGLILFKNYEHRKILFGVLLYQLLLIIVIIIILFFRFRSFKKQNAKINKINIEFDNSSWMSDRLSENFKLNRPLKNWIIPGVHDAQTGSISNIKRNDFTTEIGCFITYLRDSEYCNCVCRTQDRGSTLEKMIESGARFFDVRTNWTENEWYLVHGSCLFEQTLIDWFRESTIYENDKAYKNEVLIFSIKMDGQYNKKDRDIPIDAKMILINNLYNIFKENLLNSSNIDILNQTYNQLREQTINKNKATVIILLSDDVVYNSDNSYNLNNYPGIFERNKYVYEHYGKRDDTEYINNEYDATLGASENAIDKKTYDIYLNYGTNIKEKAENKLNYLQAFIQQSTNWKIVFNLCIKNFENVSEKTIKFIKDNWSEFKNNKRYVNVIIFNYFINDVNKFIPDIIDMNNNY